MINIRKKQKLGINDGKKNYARRKIEGKQGKKIIYMNNERREKETVIRKVETINNRHIINRNQRKNKENKE